MGYYLPAPAPLPHLTLDLLDVGEDLLFGEFAFCLALDVDLAASRVLHHVSEGRRSLIVSVGDL
jgi:hypothetical protein